MGYTYTLLSPLPPMLTTEDAPFVLIDTKRKKVRARVSEKGKGKGKEREKEREKEKEKEKERETPLSLLRMYFGNEGAKQLVRHQIESFNYFVNHQLSETVEMYSPMRITTSHGYDAVHKRNRMEVLLTFSNVQLTRPEIHENNGATTLMFPHEARLRNMTYSSPITMDIHVQYVIRSGEQLEHTKIETNRFSCVPIGKLPIMLRSQACVLTQYHHLSHDETLECEHDVGGYFVVQGSEKVIVSQERRTDNKVFCFSIPADKRYSWRAEISSVPPHKCVSPKQINLLLSNKTNDSGGFPLYVELPRLKKKKHIPLFVLFRALNVISDKDICQFIVGTSVDNDPTFVDFLHASILDARDYVTREVCLRYIATCTMYSPLDQSQILHADAPPPSSSSSSSLPESTVAGVQRKMDSVEHMLMNDLFPHCPDLVSKQYFLGYMTNRLMRRYLYRETPTDRDKYDNKRVDTAGPLLNHAFRGHFGRMMKELEKNVMREMDRGSWRATESYQLILTPRTITKFVKSSMVESGLRRALSTGDFGMTPMSNKVGVAQVLARLNYVSALSHLRRISMPGAAESAGTLIEPRKLHGSTWGRICPFETPEGQSVGVVKNMAYMAHITLPSSTESVYAALSDHVIPLQSLVSPQVVHSMAKVFVNGTWIGMSPDPLPLYHLLRAKKHRGILNVYTSVVFDYKLGELRVLTEGGRVVRPLFLANTSTVLPEVGTVSCWEQLLLVQGSSAHPLLEYMDVEEEDLCSNVAMDLSSVRERDTHAEIHPSTILGVLSSCIPFANHNPSPRNTYQCAQGKQAAGLYATNYQYRMDKTAYVLNYRMCPLVDTQLMHWLHLDKMPAGNMLMVAIMTYDGYNQDDSVLVNQGSIDRGMTLLTLYHTDRDEANHKTDTEEIRCRPEKSKTKGMKMANYGNLNVNGLVPEHTEVKPRDVLMGKVTPVKGIKKDPTSGQINPLSNTPILFEDRSKLFRGNSLDTTFVQRNYVHRNADGYEFAKVSTSTLRPPVIGDKFSSRHGQKGTCGNILSEADMPYTSEGIRPDIIINPHAIPSRMTIGQLKETLLGKVLIQLGMFGDGTAFSTLTVDAISQRLLELGYESHGNELMYNGMTGEQLSCSVFMGPTFYQRLKHMVYDKKQSRSFGPVTQMTRQPTEGKARDGGLRIGEMERDGLASHGMSRFLKERMLDVSDKFSMHVCNQCGRVGAVNEEQDIMLCKICDNTTTFSKVDLPYAANLLRMELGTANIEMYIHTSH